MKLGEPAFFPTLEAHAQAPIVGGQPPDHPLERRADLPGASSDAIRSARTTITYAQYSYEDGQIARELAEALAERCRAGVKATSCSTASAALGMPREYVETLMAKAGCEVVVVPAHRPPEGRPPRPRQQPEPSADPRRRRPRRLHGRLRRQRRGGWATGGRRTTGAIPTSGSRDPAVEYLQGAFGENWVEATGESSSAARTTFRRPTEPNGRTHAQVIRSWPAGAAATPCTPRSCWRSRRRAARSRSRTRTCCSTTR